METIRKYFYNLMTDRDNSLISYPIKLILWVLSLIYGLVLWIRDISYKIGIARSQSLPRAKIINVGNITVGGTGKTPMAIKLANFLTEKGKKVAVLLRGYGQDEYMMLRNSLENTPVIKDKNRLRSGREAINKHRVDTLILDDGFQYRRLKKDFNIVLMDSRCPFGNNHLLPRGILRDRISNLKNADVIVFTRTEITDGADLNTLKEKLKGISGGVAVFVTFHKPMGVYDILNKKELPLDFLKHRKAAALSSIGDPQYFISLLRNLGSYIVLDFSFLDHHNYRKKDIDRVVSSCKKGGVDTILTTEKDAVKIAGFIEDKSVKFFSLKISIEFKEGENDFVNRLLRIYNR